MSSLSSHEPLMAPEGASTGRGQAKLRYRRDGYSRFVDVMKFFLPALAVGLILLVVIWPQLEKDEDSFRLGISNLSPEQTRNSVMTNARFSGFDEKGQPFEVVADKAVQENAKADQINLERPTGDITLENGAWVALAAEQGLYSRAQKLLELSGRVTAFHEKGFEMLTDRATVDVAAGIAHGEEAVEVSAPFGYLSAEGFRIESRGSRVIFTGKAHMVIYPKEAEAAQ